MVAIVRRAVWDFVLYRDREERKGQYALAVDAAGWLFWDGEEESGDDGRYTFCYICSSLGIDPTRMRGAALKMKREDIQKLNNNIKDV